MASIRDIGLPTFLLLALGTLSLLAPGTLETGEARPSPQVIVTVDNSRRYQVMQGFGATHEALVNRNGDYLGPELRRQAIEAVYGQVRLNIGNVETGVLEAPANAKDPWREQANDDDDPFHFNWKGFNFVGSDVAWSKLVALAQPWGFTDYYLGLRISVHWANTWMKDLRRRDYERYLEECGEQIAAGMIHWREAHGAAPRYVQLFNEPTTGNRELDPGSIQEVSDIIKHVGRRLRKEGFAAVKFVVPSEETEERSLEVATAVLADPEARQYIGAIAYHPYPYGSIYSSVDNILRTSGSGRPDLDRIQVRNHLRDLGRRYGLPLWMTEVSHGGVRALSFDGLLGRAIHIHDELVYANASAYFAMGNMSDTRPRHGHDVSSDPFDDEGSVAIVDLRRKRVFVTGMGYAIGHYARWIRPGAVRIEATSSDPLLQVTAFRDDARKSLVLVLINNARRPVSLDVRLNGFTLPHELRFEGERSTQHAAWAPLPSFVPDTPSQFRLALPAQSVTTIATRF